MDKQTDANSGFEAIVALLAQHRGEIIIAGHTNPDGDCVGSCLAMAMGLHRLGKRPMVLLEPYNERFDIIPGKEFVLHPDGGAWDNLSPALFLCMDCGSADRVGGPAAPLLARAQTTACIDHHISNTAFTDYHYIVPTASSTCELTYQILTRLLSMDKEIASALYAGLVTDTGGFRYSCTSPETLTIAAALCATGISFTEIYTRMMLARSFTEAKILGRALHNMKYDGVHRIAYTWLTCQDMLDDNATSQDVDGVAEYLLNIGQTEVSIFIYAKTDTDIKVSFRSKQANVSRVAQAFGGGGHILAAGCSMQTAPADGLAPCMEAVLSAVRKELDANDR